MATTNTTAFKTQDHFKGYLVKCLENVQKLSAEDLSIHCKRMEILGTKVNPEFEDTIFNTDDWGNLQIEPELEFCKNKLQNALYTYFRSKVSSLPTTGVIGRSIRILVKDKRSELYIGIMCLSSDVYNLGKRDEYIGWTKEEKDIKLKNVLNLSCCVPLQPFGFNTCGGKLLATLAFSREVFDYYKRQYGDELLGIVTTSINGKSIQYDRLKQLKLIGYTKGFGTVYFPNELYDLCQKYNDIYKFYTRRGRIDRFDFLKCLLKHLGLPESILKHGKCRGIYFGYLFVNKLEGGVDSNNLKTVSQLYEEWKGRWCEQRVRNLMGRNAIKKDPGLFTAETFENVDYTPFAMPVIPRLDMTDEFIKELLAYKSSLMTLEDISKEIWKNKFVSIDINVISKVFTGKILPQEQDTEYKKLFNAKRQRTSKKRTVTDEEIRFIKRLCSTGVSYSAVIGQFKEKFGREISKGIVSSVALDKLKPLSPEPARTPCCNKSQQFTEEQMKYLIQIRLTNITSEDASLKFKEKFNRHVGRDAISKFWKGKATVPVEIAETDDYKEMTNHKRKRVVKFSDEEIQFIKRLEEPSHAKCLEMFKERFGKEMTRQYIYRIKRNVN